MKSIYLAINEALKKWTMPIKDWKPALNHFAIMFEGSLKNSRVNRKLTQKALQAHEQIRDIAKLEV